EERDHRRLPFLEDDVAPPQQEELMPAQRLLGALALREREDEGEEAARREDARGGARVVGDRAADFDPRRHGLRMRGLDGGAGREGAGADPAAVRRVEVRRQKAEIVAAIARSPPGILPSAFCLLPFARGMLCRACNTTSNNQPGGTA